MALTPAGEDLLIDGLTGQFTAASLHTADPGTTGNNEVSGNGYARQTPSYDPSSGGAADLAATLVFNGPADSAYSHLGLWVGATLADVQTTSGDNVFNGAGVTNITSAPVT